MRYQAAMLFNVKYNDQAVTKKCKPYKVDIPSTVYGTKKGKKLIFPCNVYLILNWASPPFPSISKTTITMLVCSSFTIFIH